MELTAEVVHADARPAGAGKRRRPASPCRPTFPIRSSRSSGSTPGPAERVAAGGAPVTMRVVKGANMEMERVEASLRRLAAGAVQDEARNRRQLQADAHGRHAAGEPRGGAAGHRVAQPVHAGLRAGARRAREGVRPRAVRNARRHGEPPAAGAVRADAEHAALRPGLPAGRFHQRHRLPVRRLDENTGPDNFLRHAFQHRGRQRNVAAARAAVRRTRSTRWKASSSSRGERRIEVKRDSGSRFQIADSSCSISTQQSTLNLSATNPTPIGRSSQNSRVGRIDR